MYYNYKNKHIQGRIIMKNVNSCNKSKQLTDDQIISLMSVYLDEWEHRNNLLWSQVFKMFYANLVVIILPYITNFLGVSLPEVNAKLFPTIGMILAPVFLYIGLGYAKRQQASSMTYVKVMKQLENENYQRTPIKSLKFGKYFSTPLADLLICTMFFVLETLAIVILFI